MTILVALCRAASLLAFAAPMLLRGRGGGHRSGSGGERRRGGRAPVIANFVAFGVFFASLAAFAGGTRGHAAPALAVCGCLSAVAGAGLVLRSRAELGPAWSLVPAADGSTELATAGPYRLVRHPIYLGLTLLALGAGTAFASGPAVASTLCGIVPTLLWRAREEEKLLTRAFGERYAAYQRRTTMIIPYLL